MRDTQLLQPLYTQIENLRTWNHRYSWGFRESDFATIKMSQAEEPQSFARSQIAMAWLGSHSQTFEAWWGVVSDTHERCLRFEEIESDPRHLRVTQDSYPKANQLEVLTLNLTAGWGVAVNRHAERPAHAEVLAAAAHHPMWVQAMGERNVPYAYLPGYRLLEVTQGRELVPCIGFQLDIGTILNAGPVDDESAAFAHPRRVDVSL